MGCRAPGSWFLRRRKCKLVTSNATFLQQHLLSALSHLQRKMLRGTSKCSCPNQAHQELSPGQDTEQGSANSEAVGVLGLHPITLTALPHCFPLQPSASCVLFSDGRAAVKQPTTSPHAHTAPTSSTGCCVLSRDPTWYSRTSHNTQNWSCLQKMVFLELPRYAADKIISHFITISLMCVNSREALFSQYSWKHHVSKL